MRLQQNGENEHLNHLEKMIDLRDIQACSHCGILYDKTLIEQSYHYEDIVYICPYCGNKDTEYDFNEGKNK